MTIKTSNMHANDERTRTADALVLTLIARTKQGMAWEANRSIAADTEHPPYVLQTELPLYGGITIIVDKNDSDTEHNSYSLKVLREGEKVLETYESTRKDGEVKNDLQDLYIAAEASTEHLLPDDADLAIIKTLQREFEMTHHAVSTEENDEGLTLIRDIFQDNQEDIIRECMMCLIKNFPRLAVDSEKQLKVQKIAKATVAIIANTERQPNSLCFSYKPGSDFKEPRFAVDRPHVDLRLYYDARLGDAALHKIANARTTWAADMYGDDVHHPTPAVLVRVAALLLAFILRPHL